MPDQPVAGNIPLTRMLGTFWTPANGLSMLRLLLVIPIGYLILVDGSRVVLFGLITLGVVTDFFDGRVARWSHTVSEWGKVLDPLADKVAAGGIIAALVVKKQIPLWFLGLILVRDVLVVVGGIILVRRTARILMSIWLGKVAVTALSITVLAALLQADPEVMEFCVWTTAILYVVSFILYAVRFYRILLAHPGPAEIPGPDLASVGPGDTEGNG